MDDDFRLDDYLQDDSASGQDDLDDFLSELKAISADSADTQQRTAGTQQHTDSDAFQRGDTMSFFPDSYGSETRQRTRQHSQKTAYEEEAPSGFVGFIYQHRKGINAFLLLIALALAGAIGWLFFSQDAFDPYGGKILQGVHVAGIDVGGLSKNDAVSAVRACVGSSYTEQSMNVTLGNINVVLTPAQTGIQPDIAAAVDAAYAIGREETAAARQKSLERLNGDGVNVSMVKYLNLNTDAIRSAIENTLKANQSEYSPSAYTLEGSRPPLDAENFDESNPCQTLSLYLGTPGSEPDLNAILSAITDAYDRCVFQVTIDDSLLVRLPEVLDLEAVYSAVTAEPVEAYTDAANNQTYSGSCGYTFSLTDAQAQLDAASYGDTVTISMQYVMPKKLSSKEYYTASLSEYSTEIQGEEEAYLTNLKLICRTLDGLILKPGDRFNFNTAVPNRTEANGYQNTLQHMGSCLDTGMGGGSDQFATTLYAAVLRAGMTVDLCYSCNHACAYTEIRGTEITVSQTGTDLIFRNTLSFPVQIRAKISGNKLIVRILSENEQTWYCELDCQLLRSVDPITQYVYIGKDSPYSNGDLLFEGLAGGALNLTVNTYSKATNTVIQKSSPKYYEIKSALRLIATTNR